VKGGVDLGGTKIEAVVVDESHAVQGHARLPTPTEGGPAAVTARIADALTQAAAGAGVPVSGLHGVGVGSPGAVDGTAGTVAHAKNLPDWDDPFPLAAALTDVLGPPTAVGNDVDVAVLAEQQLGAGRPFGSFLGVWWGTGVGGGVILEEARWEGRGSAGEFGHMVVRLNGARCPCGRRGCVEAYGGRGAMEVRARRLYKRGVKTSLFKIMEERQRTRLTSGVWARALREQDRVAERLVDRAIGAIAAGAASVVNLLDLEAIVVGGGLGTRLGEPYAERLRDAMLPHLFVRERPPAVLVAELGDLGGAIGAALIAPDGPDSS
jgi:glucokinase